MNNEWYTQPKYIEAARTVMGGIDLDPASCSIANQIVKASRFYTKEDNGLIQPWYGRIWLNPPYGRSANMQARGISTIRAFTDKLVAEYHAGHIEQAIILATAEINAKWFQPLWSFLVCIPDHRVRFIVPAKLDKYSQMFGTTFVYLGPNKQAFIDVFGPFGHVVERVNKREPKPAALPMWEVAV